ncbi:hypothetical protein C8A00DRAFT_36504 [Chaetomidium leptoderma]|uniref:Uncharacterized protein n=1 Tax=Chaetomidium leptoderma TaxID=669021 RepID=A0AAN6VHY0_9PEZI|nr:hypothetical protein C8A00DRAFT_36504 [Chaetomidium leptoderma]
MTAMLREVGAAGPLSWWTDWLGISEIEFGIRRFELAGALVARQREEAAAAGPLWWIDPMTGGGAAWALGLKVWPGICRFELAGALVVQ